MFRRLPDSRSTGKFTSEQQIEQLSGSRRQIFNVVGHRKLDWIFHYVLLPLLLCYVPQEAQTQLPHWCSLKRMN